MTVQMKTPKESYTFDYKVPIDLADKQMSIYWTADEINIEKDIQDIKVNMTEAEAHGVLTTLKLFTLYELVAGRDYWLNRIMGRFPRPDIQRMASTFGFFELNVHAPFYNKINEALMVNTDEFYLSYLDDPLLKDRMEFVSSLVTHKNDLVSLGAFSMVEGAVLYSSFAFLKSFQSNGKNKIVNVVRGIDFSVRDENIHCIGGAWLYNQLKTEQGGVHQDVEDQLTECAYKIYEHESRIIEMIFEMGDIEGVNIVDMQIFVKSRLNLTLEALGIQPIFEVIKNPIADWFYDSINSLKFTDFFTGISSEYNRNWNEKEFTW